jgi:hypothetical protein
MALTEDQVALAQWIFEPIIRGPIKAGVANKVRHGIRVEGTSIILFQSYPHFQRRSQWIDHDVAKFRFFKSRQIWRLYCKFRDLKWHTYKPMPEAEELIDLVNEVERDPTNIFWG